MYALDDAGRNVIAMVRGRPGASIGYKYQITDLVISREMMRVFTPPCQMTESNNRIYA